MAYSSVPTVATGDLWTASNHNTYIRDNFAAGVPDIFTAKGDLAVASGPDAASRLPVGANNLVLIADSGEPLGVKWGENVKILTTPLTNSSWDGDSKNTGTYEITANTFNNQIPINAKAIFISVKVQFPSSGAGLVTAYMSGIDDPVTITIIHIRADDSYSNESDSGLMPLVDGKFRIAISTQNLSNIWVYVYGWIL